MQPTPTVHPIKSISEPVSIKVSDYIVKFLYAQGVRIVYELPGGMITHLLNSLFEFEKIRVLGMHHEQAAAFAADAAGRITGIPGVAMATSGPGATNLLTGIGSCFYDSAPAVFITGQVNRHELRGQRAIRQLGFQECDITAMARPITKAVWQVSEASEIPEIIAQAFETALNGRPGPVLIDIPMDIQNSTITVPEETFKAQSAALPSLNPSLWPQLFSELQSAKRPLILAGGGIRAGNAHSEFLDFVKQVQIPVVNSLLATDVIPFSNPLRVGLIGSYGNRWANYALGNCDLLLVLGSRLDIRQTGNDTISFKKDRTIIHVDIEVGEMNNRLSDCIAIHSDIKRFLQTAIRQLDDFPHPSWDAWHAEIADWKLKYDDRLELQGIRGINPNIFMHQLAVASESAAAYVVDVGQHQMWAAQSLEIASQQRWLTSGGMGSMGFALPAAVGAATCLNPRPIVVIAGDGGFQCNLQELQTVSRNHLPLKIVIINNGSHGMVRQFQQTYFKEQYQSTVIGYDAPDFARVAAAFGIPSSTVTDDTEVDAALRFLWSDPESPALIDVRIDTYTNVYPKLAFGLAITDMEPQVQPTAMEST